MGSSSRIDGYDHGGKVFSFTTDRTDFTLRDWRQDKNRENPLERMEGYEPCCYAYALVL